QKLKALVIRKVQNSIYSADTEVHDAITKVRGSFERSLRAIRFLKEQGLRVKIACPLMRQNLAGYRGVQALAEELGVPYLLDLTITPKLDGDRSVLTLRGAQQALLPILQDPVLNPRGSLKPEVAKAEDDTAAQAYDNIPCSAGHNSCYVSPYGDVYPCVQMPLATGNLRQQSFTEIWCDSPEMQGVRALRESHLPICSTCTIRRYCQRCPGLAYLEDGNLLGPSERACELAEANARLAGVVNPVSALHALPAQGAAPTGPTS
ncbi:MAG: SPASM domain-containing protein, partial [Terriglobia bacterium]